MNGEPACHLLPIIFVDTIRVRRHWGSYNRDFWDLDAGALAYTDAALLAYCFVTPEFGGFVERFSDGVLVSIYTD